MITAAGPAVETDQPGLANVHTGALLGAAGHLPAVGGSHRALRVLLVMADLASAGLAWSLAFALGATNRNGRASTVLHSGLAVVALLVVAVVLASWHKLYLARVCSVRSFEVSRVLQVALLSGVASVPLATFFGVHLPPVWAAFGAAAMFVLVSTVRGAYARWLRSGRTNGRFSRPVLLVGDNDEAVELYRLTQQHPESGLRVVGVVGRSGATSSPVPDLPLLGTIDDLPNAVDSVNGVIVASSAFAPADLNRAVRNLLRADVHVHLSSGLTGISYRRLRPLPLAREPLFYVEQLQPAPAHLIAKRVLDVLLSSAVLVLSLPVLVMAALAVKLEDRRAPVIYSQQRVGRGGKLFTLYKLRSMVPDAADRLEEVQALNQRNGPLFKLAQDPRVTRVGRFLRQSSIDELPQLINVLKGDMSLVGPRPALADEVAKFDAELLARQQISPGLTGLWQVEARDNPSFNAYRRLDLFYLENWSLLLDLTIISATVMVVGGRAVQAFAGHLAPTRRRRAVLTSLD